MADPERILIVRPSALGDVCRTVPVLVTLRRAFPAAAIDWVVQSEFAAAIASHPDLGSPILFPRHELGRWWRSPSGARGMARWFAGLRRRAYDLVIDCQGLGRSGLIAWMTGAPRRVGLRSARELGWVGYNVRHAAPGSLHAVERMMSILIAEGLEPVYDMRLYANPADVEWWATGRAELIGAGARYAVLAPTSRWLSKRWPAGSWSSIVGPLRRRGFERLLLIGAPSERDQVAPIAIGEGVVDLVGRITLGQTMAVIAGAGLVVANDSAPLHMAVGFGRPCVGLYGPTDPARVGPFRRPEAVVRAMPRANATARINFKDRRLGDSLMRAIDAATVLERVDAVLADEPPAAPQVQVERRVQPAGEAVP